MLVSRLRKHKSDLEVLFDGVVLESLSTRRFLATDGNRKWAAFLFNLSSHDHVGIVKYLFISRDNYFEIFPK